MQQDLRAPIIFADGPPLYFNGFSVGISSGDLILTLMVQGKPTHTLHCSYTVAKTLANALTASVKEHEDRTGHVIMDINQVTTALEKQKPN